jgi:type IV secretory pathway protease TraF
VAVVAEPEAVSFIAQRGGRLYVYADASGLKHVKTEPPDDSAIRFKQIEADGFLLSQVSALDLASSN